MRTVKGFALFFCLMLVLILSVFAFWIMLVTQSHYAASRSLFESENARIISEAAAQNLVQTHNHQQPRLFSDPQRWNQLQLKPYLWNGYSVSGSIAAQWSPLLINLMTLRADKGRYASEVDVAVRQIRLEDFALFSDSPQSLTTSTLFDGAVYVRAGLDVSLPSRFRGLVYNDVSPSFNASYRRKSGAFLDFPPLQQLFPSGWNSGGLQINGRNPLFWQIDHYVLDLDALEISASGKVWQVRYKNVLLGNSSQLILSFDDRVSIRQTYREISYLPAGKPEISLFIHSSSDLTLESSIQTLETGSRSILLCLLSEKSIKIIPQWTAVRIEATLIAFAEVFADMGNTVLADTEKQSWVSEIRGSAFLVEPTNKDALLQALNSNEPVLWFRGSVGMHGLFQVGSGLIQLHFEAFRKTHALIPSFPFVEIVEGREQWL